MSGATFFHPDLSADYADYAAIQDLRKKDGYNRPVPGKLFFE